MQRIKQGIGKTGIITDVTELSHVFQQRPLAEYFIAKWLCDNLQTSRPFMSDYLLELGFVVVRSVVDRILADKYPLHQATLKYATCCKAVEKDKIRHRKGRWTKNPAGCSSQLQEPTTHQANCTTRSRCKFCRHVVGFVPSRICNQNGLLASAQIH